MEWNHLPPETVTAKTLNLFKGVIDPLFQQNMGLYISQTRLPSQVLKSNLLLLIEFGELPVSYT